MTLTTLIKNDRVDGSNTVVMTERFVIVSAAAREMDFSQIVCTTFVGSQLAYEFLHPPGDFKQYSDSKLYRVHPRNGPKYSALKQRWQGFEWTQERQLLVIAGDAVFEPVQNILLELGLGDQQGQLPLFPK